MYGYLIRNAESYKIILHPDAIGCNITAYMRNT